MKLRFYFVLLPAIFLISPTYAQAVSEPNTNKTESEKMLIVITAPPSNTAYYREVYEKIIRYDIEFAKKVIGKDDIVVLGDKKALSIFRKELPEEILLKADMRDIWMRDFTTVNPYSPVQFRYAAAAQGGKQSEADWVQKGFNKFAKKLGIEYSGTELILDGGNLVDNYEDKIIVTDRFLEDNELTREEGVRALKELLHAEHVAIIPSDDPGGLAHADGMAMFIETNTIALNKYEEPFRSRVIKELKKSFPGIKIVEIETKFDDSEWDDRFSSACGIYTNSIVTEGYIYLPQFGTGLDKKALKTVRDNTNKEVVPIDASRVCFMGGSVRCLGWQQTGENAKKLTRAALVK